MAITKRITPKIPSMGFIPMWFQSSSTNVGQSNFRFVYDTFTTTTGVTSNSRNRLYPNPNNNYSEYSPSRILESYLYFEAYPTLTGSTGSTGSYMNYRVAIGEEYGSLTTGTTTYSALTNYTGICLNGTLQYEEIPSWSTTGQLYTMTGSTGQFLTNSKIDIGYLNTAVVSLRGTRAYGTDWFTLSFFNDMRETYRPNFIDIVVWNITGQSTSAHRIAITSATATTSTWMQHIGIGPMNLNNTSASRFVYGGVQPVIDTTRDLWYKVYVTNSAQGQLSEEYFVSLVPPGGQNGQQDTCKYPVREFIFQNRRGQAEHLTFSMISQRSVSANRDLFERVLDYNYQIGQRGQSVTDLRAQETLKVTTDWITESENIQVEEFLTSPEIFLLNSTNTLVPYVLNTGSVLFKTRAVDKLINYTFEMQPSYSINTQRAGNQRTTASGGNAGGGGGVPIGDFDSTT